MKKKYRVKKWVTNLLIAIAFISVMVISGECEKDLLFIIKGIVGTTIFTLCSMVLIKYGNI